MKHRRAMTLATATVAGLALAVSTGTGPTTAASHGPSGTPATPAAKGPAAWTKISTGAVSSISEPALYRTTDGVLHVAYAKGGANDALRWSNLSKRGRLLARGTILSGWDTYSNNPKLIAAPDNGVRIVFGGIDADGSAPYNNNRLFTATAGSAGTDWTLAPNALLSTAPIATYGIGAVAYASSAPKVAVAYGDTIYWRYHDGSTAPAGPDQEMPNGDCCAYHVALARDAKMDRGYFAWYSGGGARRSGIFVRWTDPFSTGPKLKAPGSSRLDPNQTVALTARNNALGGYVAYCTGYPSCKSIKLWRVGARKAITVPRSKNADNITIAKAPKGRLWVVWNNDTTNRVHATLTNRKATRFGAVRTVKAPQRDVYRLSAYAGGRRPLDVVVNTGGELFHRQLLPGLRLTAKPRRFDNDSRHVVTFRVTDAGTPVAGAKVRVAGKTERTNAKGKATIAFRKEYRPGRYPAAAAKPGYAKGHVTIRVRR